MNRKCFILLSLFYLTSCGIFPNEDTFSIKFSNENTTFYNIDNNEIDLSIYKYDYIDIKLPSSSWNKDSDNKNSIDFKYDVSKIKVNYIYQSSYNHTLSYQIQTIEEFENSKFIVIFNDTEYKINISSFSPSKDEYHILSNDELNDNYKEFKKMLDSIKYHYYESPYIGLDVLRDDRVRNYYFNYEFNNEYNLDYLPYLKDDTFYPSKFDFARPNITYNNLSFWFEDTTTILKDSPKTIIPFLDISFGVVDPGCTLPENPFWSMSFSLCPLNYKSNNEIISKSIDYNLNNTYYLLSKRYEDIYFKYDNNDLKINLINIKEGNIFGFFNDDTYLYFVSCTYNK